MALSEIAIRNAKVEHGKAQRKLADGAGLYLLITADGSKYWRLKYRWHGKEKVLALGVYPDTKASDARAKRDEAKKLLREGRDPSAVRREQKQAAKAAAANNFEGVAREWVEKKRHEWTADHADAVLKSLEDNLFPDLGTRPISLVTAPELLATLRRIEAREAFETAQRLLQRCRAVFAYAVATSRAERNVAIDLTGALKAPVRSNRAALSSADLPEFLRKLDAYDGRLQTKLAMQLQALTFVRPGELRGAEWTEFDLDAAEWRIPAERMKMRTPHVVPLSRQALEVLEQLKRITGGNKYLFPNQAKPHAPMSENTVLFALYRMGYHSRATAHGFRATASTILNEQGWKPDAIERQLAHKERNRVRAAYHRSEYLDERRKMMQAWADYLDALKAGAKVTGIRKVAAEAA